MFDFELFFLLLGVSLAIPPYLVLLVERLGKMKDSTKGALKVVDQTFRDIEKYRRWLQTQIENADCENCHDAYQIALSRFNDSFPKEG